MSIDELFILTRLLSTTGELFHYLEVRQSVAGIKGAKLFDEFDHLGAYISRNRFDMDLREQLVTNDFTIWDGFSDVVDEYFGDERWQELAPPKQEFPTEILNILSILESTRGDGWLRADCHLRNMNQQSREKLATMLEDLRPTLGSQVCRYLVFGEDPPLMVWLQKADTEIDVEQIQFKAKSATIMAQSTNIIVLICFISPENGNEYLSARLQAFSSPAAIDKMFPEYSDEAERMKSRMKHK